MKYFILKQLVEPAMRRIGSAGSAYLIGIGVAASSVEQIMLGLSAALAVGLELVLSAKARK